MTLNHEMLDQPETNALDEERVQSIQGYELSPCRVILFVLVSIVTCGLFPLLCYWLKKLYVFSTCRKTTNERASRIVIVDEHKRMLICPVKMNTDGNKILKSFSYKLLRFVFDEEISEYIPMEYNTEIPFVSLQNEMLRGHSELTAEHQRALFGINSIEVPVKPWYRVLLEECLHPFFMFQIFSVIIWSINDYLPYAMAVLGMSIISVIMNMIETLRNLKNIHEMSKQNIVVTIQRQGTEAEDLPSDQIVPGDVVHLRSGTAVPCDIVLLSGQCIVNETMLTGESIPMIKTALPFTTDPADKLNVEHHKNHILFGGTTIISAKNTSDGPTQGIAIRTGFNTAKGRLIRSMLFPKPTKFRFYSDSFKFIGVLFLIAMVGFVVVIIFLIRDGEELFRVIFKSLDIVTVAVPPALPAAMSIGVTYASRRLKKKKIFCIDQNRINVAGKLRMMCFDKTGTLTEEGLDVRGVVGVKKRETDEMEGKFVSGPSQPSPPRSHSHSPENFGEIGAVVPLKVGERKRRRRSNRKGKQVEFTDMLFTTESLQDAVLNDLGAVQIGNQEACSRLLESVKDNSLHRLLEGFSTCHSLARVEGTLIGDPLDVKMFDFTRWIMEENDGENNSTVSKGNAEQSKQRTDKQNAIIAKLCQHYHVDDNNERKLVERMTRPSSSNTDADDSEDGDEGVIVEEDNTNVHVVATTRPLAVPKADRSLVRNSKDLRDSEAMNSNLAPTQNLVFCHTQELLSEVEVDVLQRFDFSSHLQRMSVVVNRKTSDWTSLDVFVKGSPEIIKTLCKSKSIPENFNTLVKKYTKDGYRVIALATRRLGYTSKTENIKDTDGPNLPVFLVDKLHRNDVEQDLTFLGLLVLENRLREQSAPAIAELSGARIKSVMVTGDNPLTAVHVAKGCGILNKDETVFIGDVVDGEVKWVCQDDERITLDPYTLLPRKPNGMPTLNFSPSPFPSSTNPAVNETQSTISDGTQNSETSTMGLLNGTDSNVNLPPTTQSNAYPALVGTLNRPEQTIEKGTRKYGLAITGAAFTILLAQEEERLHRLEMKKEQLAEKSMDPNSRLSPLDFHSSPFSRLVYLCRVFARMSPDDKTSLVEKYISLGYTTGMCGDGANDCGALKAAHVGISLSEVEASIAAPFTSLEANISCVPELILEGRASLVTSFQAFKYMALYSLVQFITVTLLLVMGADLSTWMYLILDAFLVLPIAFTMSYTQPSKKLSETSPESALVSFPVLFTLFFHFGIFLVTQFTVFFLTINAPWFNNEHPVEDPDWSYCLITLCMYTFSQFQYVWIAIVVNLSGKYKRSQFTNWMYTVVIIIELAWAAYTFFTPGNAFTNALFMYDENKWNQPWGYQLKHRLILFGLNVGGFILSIICEYLVVVWGAQKRARREVRRKRSRVGDRNHISLAPKYQPKMKLLDLPTRVTTTTPAGQPVQNATAFIQPTPATASTVEDETRSNVSSQFSVNKETESLLHSLRSHRDDVTSLASWHAEFERDFSDMRDLEELKARLTSTRIFENMAGEVVWQKKKEAYSMKWKKEYHKIIWDLIEEDKDLKQHSH
ncbi:ion-transporting P-type ATPase [Blattamonas nauphoetae]|uniref:Cation-transporting ATPase n=1 Tax=Blattamonas nauphoetae TaxID=2049346 RepID=A0ABQ9XJM3_9EUKA|nr:ion-transporting P-type ATPase [Blattamonas nauphoetae]